MVDESISLSAAEFGLFKALTEAQVPFMVVGLSAALLQGVPAVTQDIDLWVQDLKNPAFAKAVEQAGAIYIPPGVAGMNPPLLAGQEFRGIDLVTSCQGLSTFEEEAKKALSVEIRGLRVLVLGLDRIILSKETANREKDVAALPMLRAALLALSEK